jgi:pimeloyl-ACP methyl ester carboxylesterase
MSTDSRQVVILAHGIGAFPLTMALLEKRLVERGFRTINWSYPSYFRSIDAHAARLCERLDRLENNQTIDTIHFVGHSMGSIVCRAAILAREATSQKFGRFVMLAPPNHGSFVARWVSPLVGWLSPPVRELSDEPTSYVNRMGWPRQIETAVFTPTYDLLVSNASTHMPAARVTRQFPGFHSYIVLRRDVAKATADFLQNGS